MLLIVGLRLLWIYVGFAGCFVCRLLLWACYMVTLLVCPVVVWVLVFSWVWWLGYMLGWCLFVNSVVFVTTFDFRVVIV